MANIIGTNDPEYLIGTVDADVLEGLGGNDTLDGGVGNDTYIYNFGDGTDTITDADGLGSIVYRDALGVEYVLRGGVRSPTGSVYYDGQGRFQYTLDEATNILSVTLDGQLALTIQNYDSIAQSLGIGLAINQAPAIQIDGAPFLEPIRLVSMAADGTEASGSSYDASISADGRYVVFTSIASNLVGGDTNGTYDTFVKDLQTGAITRVNTAADGAQANSSSGGGSSISADGRYVAFWGMASNLVAGDTNGTHDIFVKDLQTGAIVRASTAADGTQASGGHSYIPSISADGRYVVFSSAASNLVSGDANGTYDIFVKDLQTGAITRANTAADGTEANGISGSEVSISTDGRYVAFKSEASNLVAGDTNGASDIFVKDLQTGAITRANTAADGTEANGISGGVSISADGRYVAFESAASNLVAGDLYGNLSIFVKDLQTGAIVCASTAADGVEANGYSAAPSISADGRYVSFTSTASNLVADDTNGTFDTYVKDLQTGAIRRVSIATDGTEANGSNLGGTSISADGSYVTFISYASNLVAGDMNGIYDIFIAPNALSKQITTNSNVAVTIDGLSVADTDAGTAPLSISLLVGRGSLALQSTAGITFTDADGSDGTLAFSGSLSDLNATLAAGVLYTPLSGYSGSDQLDVVVDDQVYGASLTDSAALAITIIPNTITGTSGNDSLIGTAASDAITSDAGNDTLTGGLGNDTLIGGVGNDTYIYNFGDGTDSIVDADGLGSIVYRDALGTEYVLSGGVRSPTGSVYYDEQGRFQYTLDEATNILSVTLDGQLALTIQNYDSVAETLGLALGVNQVPVISINGDSFEAIRLVSMAADGTQANDYSYIPSISADGRYVAFVSSSSNFVAGDTNGADDIFVKDLQTGIVTRASTAADGTEANDNSEDSAISADGRYVTFTSFATDLVAGDTNGVGDIFVKDLQSGAIVRASTAADGAEANDSSSGFSISADGRYVAFISSASNLVAGDTNGIEDIFVKDLQTGVIVRVNTAADGTEANNNSFGDFSISADGRYVAFASYASNLIVGDTNGIPDIFVKDLQTGAIIRVNTAADGTEVNDYSNIPAISADGRYVAFYSYASDLVAGDTNNVADVFVKDIQTGAITRASTAADGAEANGPSYSFSISADGRYVSFSSGSSNLVAGDTNGIMDTFVKDLQTGAIARVNIATNGAEANGQSYDPSISANGRFAAFVSAASNLVAGDTNGMEDVFIVRNPFIPYPVPSVVTNADTPIILDGISVSDFDAGATPLAVTLSVVHGSLALQSTTGVTFTDADGNDGTLAFSGSLSDLNAALTAGILYAPDTGYSGDDALDLTVNDQVYGAALMDNATIGITILPPSGPTPGPDNLTGTAGADTLAGGQGNDTLSGGAGDDTYVFNPGDGIDTIDDLSLVGEGNALQFGTGIDPTAVTLSYEGGYLVLNLGGGDQLRLSNFSNTDVYGNHAVETFTFADGTVLSYSQLIDRGFDLVGTAGDDVIQGTNGVDRIVGGDGNDVINGGGGDDILSGGLGDDTYYFDAGNGNDTVYDNAGENNTLVFGSGVDPNSVTLNLGSLFLNIGNGEGIHLEGFDPNDAYNTSVVQTFVFDDGTTLDLNQLLARGFDIDGTDGDDALTGTSVTDRIAGGLGNDSLNGGAGDDTYFYNQGDGLDTLADSDGNDTVSLGAGFSFDSTVIRVSSGIARLRFLDADDNEGAEGIDITLNGDDTAPIETFAFENGTTYSFNDLLITTQTLYGTKKADTLTGGRNDDTIYAGKGGDALYGRTGNDTLYGEKGNDKLYGEGGDDNLYGGKGKDYLDGGAGDDYLDGGKGHNTLIGGKGNDTLILGKGEDTVRFDLGDGWDTLKTAAKDPEDSEIRFGTDITQDNLWFSRSGNDLLINILGTDNGMTIEGWYSNKHKPIEEIKTANGYELEDKKIELLVQAMAAFSPTPGSGDPLPTEMPDPLQPVLAAAWETGH